jgi:hypothetical protein
MNDTIPKLMALAEWRQSRFTDNSRPSHATAVRWCSQGHVPAKRIGGKWFVFAAEEAMMTGNELVDAVLRAG